MTGYSDGILGDESGLFGSANDCSPQTRESPISHRKQYRFRTLVRPFP